MTSRRGGAHNGAAMVNDDGLEAAVTEYEWGCSTTDEETAAAEEVLLRTIAAYLVSVTARVVWVTVRQYELDGEEFWTDHESEEEARASRDNDLTNGWESRLVRRTIIEEAAL